MRSICPYFNFSSLLFNLVRNLSSCEPEDMDRVIKATPIRHCPELCKENVFDIVKMTESDLNMATIERALNSAASAGEEYDFKPE